MYIGIEEGLLRIIILFVKVIIFIGFFVIGGLCLLKIKIIMSI